MALIENIQREDLNPIEEALAYRRLADEFQLTQEDIADRGRQGSRVGRQFLRLLKLPDEVRSEVASGALSMGHARALLVAADEADQRRIARDVIARSLSVRETESLVKKIVETRRRAREAAEPEAGRRPHARRRGSPQAPARHPRPHRPPGRARPDRDRFRSEEELIRIFEQLTDEQTSEVPASARIFATPVSKKGGQMTKRLDANGRLRRLSEQTRRWRARSGAE